MKLRGEQVYVKCKFININILDKKNNLKIKEN